MEPRARWASGNRGSILMAFLKALMASELWLVANRRRPLTYSSFARSRALAAGRGQRLAGAAMSSTGSAACRGPCRQASGPCGPGRLGHRRPPRRRWKESSPPPSSHMSPMRLNPAGRRSWPHRCAVAWRPRLGGLYAASASFSSAVTRRVLHFLQLRLDLGPVHAAAIDGVALGECVEVVLARPGSDSQRPKTSSWAISMFYLLEELVGLRAADMSSRAARLQTSTPGRPPACGLSPGRRRLAAPRAAAGCPRRRRLEPLPAESSSRRQRTRPPRGAVPEWDRRRRIRTQAPMPPPMTTTAAMAASRHRVAPGSGRRRACPPAGRR